MLVVLVGFFVLGLLAYRTYMAHPPVPARVVDPNGDVALHRQGHQPGQQVFLHNGLMEYGSAFGHGAYLGPDYTADYLRRSSDLVRDVVRRRRLGRGRAEDDRRTCARNRYDARDRHADVQRGAGRRRSAQLVPYYSRFFSDPKTEHGLRPDAITDPTSCGS